MYSDQIVYQAAVQVHAFIADLTVHIIGVGGQQYMTNPIGGKWGVSAAADTLDLAALLDPQHGIGPLMSNLSGAHTVGSETVGGVATYHLQATVTGSTVSSITFGILGQKDVKLDLWIGQSDHELHQLYLQEVGTNPIFWALTFSNYNVPVNIQKPNL